MIRADPDEWQEAALQALVTHKRVSIAACHGPGKDALAAWAILWVMCCFVHPKIPCTAPTGHQLYDLLWSEIAKWFVRLPALWQSLFELKRDRFERKRHRSTWFAVARTARKENPEGLAGFHADTVLVVVDEASGVPEASFETLEGAMTTANCMELLIGNPTQASGYFHASHHTDGRWFRMRIMAAAAHAGGRLPRGCWTSPRVASGYVQAMARKYGVDSNVYRVRVLGKFPRSSDDQAIPFDWIERATMRDVPADHWKACPQKICLGVDVARFGSDSTAVVARQGSVILGAWAWHGHDTAETTSRVKALAYRLKKLTAERNDDGDVVRPGYLPPVLIDGVGVGAGVVDQLREDKALTVIDVQAGEASPDPDCFRKRDMLWWRGRSFYQDDSPVIAPASNDEGLTSLVSWTPQRPAIATDLHERLTAELATPRYGFAPDGRIKVETKDEVKERLGAEGASPDVADAHNLTLNTSRWPKPKEERRSLMTKRTTPKSRWGAGF